MSNNEKKQLNEIIVDLKKCLFVYPKESDKYHDLARCLNRLNLIANPHQNQLLIPFVY